MDKNKLIELAYNSKMLKGLSYNLCKGRDIHNDLFQEFIMKIINKDEAFLIKKYNEIQFISYCSNVIKGLNSMRYRDAKAVNTKNPLVEKYNEVEFECEVIDENYNYEVDLKYNKTLSLLKNIEGSDLLIESINSTTRQVAEDYNLKQRQLIYKNNKIKNKLKGLLK